MDEKNIHILVVEDDKEDILLLREYLRQNKDQAYSFIEAFSVKEAIEKINENQIDIILLDLNLKDSSGIRTFEVVKDYAFHTPIIILSGLDDEDTAREIVRKGAQDFLLKKELSTYSISKSISYSLDRKENESKLLKLTEELEETNQKLIYLANHDPLTGVLNRRGVEEILNRESLLLKRRFVTGCAIFIDMDNFKSINDTYSHSVGDEVLKFSVKNMLSCIRDTDHLGRIGGDEFLIYLPKTKLMEAALVAEKVRGILDKSNLEMEGEKDIKISASLGVVELLSYQDCVLNKIIEKVDPELQQSKRSGKNRITYNKLTKSENFQEEKRDKVIQVLKQGTEFKVLKQPIVNIQEDKIVGYEYLSRLNTDVFNMPTDFFRLALEENILDEVDKCCFQNCIEAIGKSKPDLKSYVNIFPTTIQRYHADEILRILEPLQDLEHFRLELSEQQIIGDPIYFADSVKELKRQGVKVAVDDIGFGQDCIECLVILEPDVVKVDHRCVKNISNSPSTQRQFKRLMNILNAMHSEVIVEGVETLEELNYLKDMGVVFAQGFYLGRPS